MFSQLSISSALAGLVTLSFAAPAPQYGYGSVSSSCSTSVTAQAGDSCSSIAAAAGISASEFQSLNPSINSGCTNLFAGTAYCVSDGSAAPPPAASSPPSPVASSPPAVSSVASSPPASSSGLADTNTSIQVTNATAFASGAGNTNNANTEDGVGAGADAYTCFSGTESAYPDVSQWVSFSDMWNNNAPFILTGCTNLGVSPDTTEQQLGFIYEAIQSVAQASLVDHRFILATIMQESIGCVNTPATQNGVNNPGLMQSHNGSSFVGSAASPEDQAASIQQMIIDGVQGTPFGDGAVQGINSFGNVFDAAHLYNSGFDDSVSDLNSADGATASYVVNIANRLLGWITAPEITCN